MNFHFVHIVIDGYHWASTAEADAIFGVNLNNDGTLGLTTVYSDKGGWDTLIDNDGDSNSFKFIFNDTWSTRFAKDARKNDRYQTRQLGNVTSTVAGLVLIKDQVEVPEPSTLAIFALGMIGLASRQFKKQS